MYLNLLPVSGWRKGHRVSNRTYIFGVWRGMSAQCGSKLPASKRCPRNWKLGLAHPHWRGRKIKTDRWRQEIVLLLLHPSLRWQNTPKASPSKTKQNKKTPAGSEEAVSLSESRMLLTRPWHYLKRQRTTCCHIFPSDATTRRAVHHVTSEVPSKPVPRLLQSQARDSLSAHAGARGASQAGQSLPCAAACSNGGSPEFVG